MPQAGQPWKKRYKIMGDKSPKSNQKKNSQKQAVASSASQKKAQAVAAKIASLKNAARSGVSKRSFDGP